MAVARGATELRLLHDCVVTDLIIRDMVVLKQARRATFDAWSVPFLDDPFLANARMGVASETH
jgi:hypothetical protein